MAGGGRVRGRERNGREMIVDLRWRRERRRGCGGAKVKKECMAHGHRRVVRWTTFANSITQVFLRCWFLLAIFPSCNCWARLFGCSRVHDPLLHGVQKIALAECLGAIKLNVETVLSNKHFSILNSCSFVHPFIIKRNEDVIMLDVMPLKVNKLQKIREIKQLSLFRIVTQDFEALNVIDYRYQLRREILNRVMSLTNFSSSHQRRLVFVSVHTVHPCANSRMHARALRSGISVLSVATAFGRITKPLCPMVSICCKLLQSVAIRG